MMSMRFIVMVVLVTAQLASSKEFSRVFLQEWLKLSSPYADGCLKEVNGTAKQLRDFLKHGEVIHTRLVSCYVKCLYVKLKIMGGDGHIDVALVNSLGLSYMTPQITEQCHKEALLETDLCKKSYDFADCIVERVSV